MDTYQPRPVTLGFNAAYYSGGRLPAVQGDFKYRGHPTIIFCAKQ